MKQWQRKKKRTSSMMRSRTKKSHKGNLPSNPMLDPFLMKRIKYNRNGRILVLEFTGWKELRV